MWNNLLLDRITVLSRRFSLYSGVWDSGKRYLTKLGLEVTESVSCYDDLCKERSWPGGIAGLLYIILFIVHIIFQVAVLGMGIQQIQGFLRMMRRRRGTGKEEI